MFWFYLITWDSQTINVEKSLKNFVVRKVSEETLSASLKNELMSSPILERLMVALMDLSLF